MVETRGGRRLAVFFLVSSFLVLLLGRWIKPVDDAALTVAAPFASVVSSVADGVSNLVTGVVEGPRLYNENQQLRTEMETLLQQNITLKQEQHENTILRAMLNFHDQNGHMDLFPARVIASDANVTSVAPYIIINRGSRDGLRDGMTVLDQYGNFVGSISDVISNASKVLLMVSASSSVGAIDLKTRAVGLVEGEYASQPLFKFSVASQSMHAGDLVVTSGDYNLYPRNILLGQIVRVTHRNVSLFQTGRLRPAADFSNLEIVQVVRNYVPSVPVKLLNQ
jgi:rod shape-determining protein MreC